MHHCQTCRVIIRFGGPQRLTGRTRGDFTRSLRRLPLADGGKIRDRSGAGGCQPLMKPLSLTVPPSPPLLGEIFFPFLFPSAGTGCHDNIEHSFHGERPSRLSASATGGGTGTILTSYLTCWNNKLGSGSCCWLSDDVIGVGGSSTAEEPNSHVVVHLKPQINQNRRS